MNISSISRSAQQVSLRSVQQNTAERSPAARKAAVESDTKVSISKPAEVLQKLKSLQETKPEQLEETLSDVAKHLQKASDNSKGEGREQLRQLASRFAAASERRDLPALQPKKEDASAPSPSAPKLGGVAGRALAAYAKNGPPAKPDDSTQRALDVASKEIDQAMSSRLAATVPSSLSSLTSSR